MNIGGGFLLIVAYFGGQHYCCVLWGLCVAIGTFNADSSISDGCFIAHGGKRALTGIVLAQDRQFQFKTAHEAEGRAQRVFEAGDCVGANAYSVMFDPEAEALLDQMFLLLFGKKPSVEE